MSRYLPLKFKKYFLTIWHIQQKTYVEMKINWKSLSSDFQFASIMAHQLHSRDLNSAYHSSLLRSPDLTPQYCFLCAFLQLEEHIYIYFIKQDFKSASFQQLCLSIILCIEKKETRSCDHLGQQCFLWGCVRRSGQVTTLRYFEQLLLLPLQPVTL